MWFLKEKGTIVNSKEIKVILSAKLGLSGDNRELQFGSGKQWQNHRQVQQTKGRTIVLRRRRKKLGGIVLNENLLEKSMSPGL